MNSSPSTFYLIYRDSRQMRNTSTIMDTSNLFNHYGLLWTSGPHHLTFPCSTTTITSTKKNNMLVKISTTFYLFHRSRILYTWILKVKIINDNYSSSPNNRTVDSSHSSSYMLTTTPPQPPLQIRGFSPRHPWTSFPSPIPYLLPTW